MMQTDFLESFAEVSRIGATEAGGVERQAATNADGELRAWFRGFAERHDWQTRIDGIGNLYALVELSPGAPYVFVGSHLDSQPRGGKYDGAYGVIAALHAAERLQARAEQQPGAAAYNLAVVDWFNEEGGRFQPSIMGSSVFAGIMDRDTMLQVTDLAGTSVREALTAIDALGSDEPPQPAAYAEIHIEQGRILEREGIGFGVVDSTWYTQKLDIEVTGEQSHTGATLMADRHDALYVASRVITMLHDICDEFEPEALMSSVGYFTVEPNSPIVVNRYVRMVGDLRSNDPEIVQAARDRLVQRFDALQRETGVEVSARDFDVRPKLYYPNEGVELAEKVAADAGVEVRRMQTMAGHDSVPMNTVVPTVMLFIPSVDGVSHCEREFTRDEDLVAGVDFLTRVVWELLQGRLDHVPPAPRY
ncbi:M20 family metallo-hydrolase [Naumannella sp. ID2617S]|nr:M20 family metallo-hydrolase [Naumannella sp. ID2617S]